jgi:hypothetical protein
MRLTSIASLALVATLLMTAFALGEEHHAPPPSPPCGTVGPQAQRSDPSPMMGRGMMSQGTGMPMLCGACPMMRQMVGATMEPPEMGMMGMMGAGKDRKAAAQMLQMRGEMLKAMGEILLKYGTLMAEEGK